MIEEEGFNLWKRKAFMWILICFSMMISGCALINNNPSSENLTDEKIYSIEIICREGEPLKDIDIRVYEDETYSELVVIGKTDENGIYSFKAKPSDKYVVQLQEVPVGYKMDESYKFSGEELKISLETQLLSREDVQKLIEDNESIYLGDIAADMVIMEGNQQYSVSNLLENKRAVVINFWFENCGPCKAEFPYMQEAYEKYQDEIEILAVNPYDGNEESVAKYKETLGLAFPVAKADVVWAQAYNIQACPTTIVIDRYGVVSFMHSGIVPSTEEFEKLFEYFVSDEYEKSIINNWEDLAEK